jgi:tetratricopeptide (TPR) repeat protein
MRRPLSDPVDVETGREISLRDGGIRVLISGRIEKIGNTYQISTSLVNPGDGVTQASFSAYAENQDQILSAISELAHDVRVTLGEGVASIEESEEMLAKVTTPSLPALRLYSRANVMMAGPDRSQALPVLEEAVRIDPDFASAHLLLSYALGDLGELDRLRQHLQRAVELADQATERERLFILGTYYWHLGDMDRTMQTYNLLLRLYPDHFWANGNIANRYEMLGEFEEGYPHKVRGAEWGPNQFWPLYSAAQFAMAVGDFDGAKKFMESARALPANNPWETANLIPAAVHEAWIKGDYSTALKFLDEIVAASTPEDLVANSQLFGQIRSLYASLGLLDRFKEISAWRPQMGWLEAVAAQDSGDIETVETYFQTEIEGFWGATLLASAGKSERARNVLTDPHIADNLPPFFFEPDWRNLAEGHVALAEGRYQDAANMLSNHMMMLCVTAKYAYLFAMNSLAHAHEALGNTKDAIETLEMAGRQKPLTIFEPGATWMWLRNQMYLHEIYLHEGRVDSAQRVEAEIRDALQLADRDHPFLLALELRKGP